MADKKLHSEYSMYAAGDGNLDEIPSRYTREAAARTRKLRERATLKKATLAAAKTKTQDGSVEVTFSDIELHRRIDDSDSDGSSVDENYDVASLTESLEETLTWRGRMQVSVHSPYLHLAIVLLVVMDALIVLFELLLDVGAFGNIHCRGENTLERNEFCHLDSESRGDCGPHAQLILRGLNISESPDGRGVSGLCTCGFRGGELVCINDDSGHGINPALFLHVTSLAILSIFMLEIVVKLIAFRLKYFTHKFEVFDGMVVVMSWTLDIASLLHEEAFEAASLLIILRLWRVVRIVNGAVLSAKTQSDNRLTEARKHARKIVHAFHKAQDRLDIVEEENEKLKGLVHHYKRDKHAKDKKAGAQEKQPFIMPQPHPSDDESDEELRGVHVSRGPPTAPPTDTPSVDHDSSTPSQKRIPLSSLGKSGNVDKDGVETESSQL